MNIVVKKIIKKAVPDTSVIIEGLISKQIKNKNFGFNKIIIHEAVLAELESQANKKKETGHLGLEEIEKIRKLSSKNNIELEFKGNRPGDFEIKFAKSGEIDSLIRELAFKEKGTLITADIVQSKVAKAKGILVKLYKFSQDKSKKLMFEKYFDKNTMSLHIKENCFVYAKKGKPGSWNYSKVSKEVISRDEVRNLTNDILDLTRSDINVFLELDKKTTSIIQINGLRIVIVRPPLSDGFELIIVKATKKLSFNDYKVSNKLKERLLNGAKGILVVGDKGQGKTVFVQSLAKRLFDMGNNIKTLESQRDMFVPKEIVQYNLNQNSMQELNDIFSISRPDYIFFDEIKSLEDYRFFSDLRLSGIKMVGVISSNSLEVVLDRFIKRSDLNLITNIVDTIVIIKGGSIAKIFSLDIVNKEDKKKIFVENIVTAKKEFELYDISNQTVVVRLR